MERVYLQNIRCVGDVEIKLYGRSALIIGDNGDGKSTIIRSLAMGLWDDSSAAALFRELHGETVRQGSKSAALRWTFVMAPATFVPSLKSRHLRRLSGDNKKFLSGASVITICAQVHSD